MSLWGCEELYVNNLPDDASESEVIALFGQHGTVREVVMNVGKRHGPGPAGPSSSACIVRFASHPEAVSAKKALHKHEWNGKPLNVKWSHNQRVLWVAGLDPSVTNEVLQAAFSQFGTVTKAIVVCDAPTNTSKCWGYVAFENKRFAIRTLAAVRERPFVAGAGSRPVRVDWARNEEFLEGFTEELKQGLRGAKLPDKQTNPEEAGFFPSPNTPEGQQAIRLNALRMEYEDLKRLMAEKLAQAEQQAMAGPVPRLISMVVNDPRFAPPPPPSGPPRGPGGPMGPYGPRPLMGGPPPMGGGPMGGGPMGGGPMGGGPPPHGHGHPGIGSAGAPPPIGPGMMPGPGMGGPPAGPYGGPPGPMGQPGRPLMGGPGGGMQGLGPRGPGGGLMGPGPMGGPGMGGGPGPGGMKREADDAYGPNKRQAMGPSQGAPPPPPANRFVPAEQQTMMNSVVQGKPSSDPAGHAGGHAPYYTQGGTQPGQQPQQQGAQPQQQSSTYSNYYQQQGQQPAAPAQQQQQQGGYSAYGTPQQPQAGAAAQQQQAYAGYQGYGTAAAQPAAAGAATSPTPAASTQQQQYAAYAAQYSAAAQPVQGAQTPQQQQAQAAQQYYNYYQAPSTAASAAGGAYQQVPSSASAPAAGATQQAAYAAYGAAAQSGYGQAAYSSAPPPPY